MLPSIHAFTSVPDDTIGKWLQNEFQSKFKSIMKLARCKYGTINIEIFNYTACDNSSDCETGFFCYAGTSTCRGRKHNTSTALS